MHPRCMEIYEDLLHYRECLDGWNASGNRHGRIMLGFFLRRLVLLVFEVVPDKRIPSETEMARAKPLGQRLSARQLALLVAKDSVAQIDRRSEFPFPRTALCHDFRYGYSEGGEAVQHGNADLELCDLTIEVPSCEALAQQLDAVHLGFCAASAVVAAPSSPDGSPEAF